MHSDARIRKCIAELRLKVPDASGEGRYATPTTRTRLMLRTIRQMCDLDQLREEFANQLQAALDSDGLHADPKVNDPSLDLDDWVYFSRLPFPESSLVFGSEDSLRAFLLDQIGRAGCLKPLKLLAKEHTLQNGKRVDILCEERRRHGGGPLVAIELKKDEPGDGVVLQLARYLEQLAKEYPGREVRGMIVCGPEEELPGRDLIQHLKWPIDWYQYRVELKRAGTDS